MHFSCPHCGKALRCHKDQIGRIVKCVSCQQSMRVGEPYEYEPELPRPRRQVRYAADEPRRKSWNGLYVLIGWLAFLVVSPCLASIAFAAVMQIVRPMPVPHDSQVEPAANINEQNVVISTAGQVTVNQNSAAGPSAGTRGHAAPGKNR